MASGRIIFLNGTSSSGKSSIAGELLGILDNGVFFHMAVDLNAMRSKAELGTEELDTALRQTRMGFRRSVAAMAHVGQRHRGGPCAERAVAAVDCLTVLRPEDVLFGRFHCPRDLAAHQYDLVHGQGDYGLECDTSAASPRECAHQINELLPQRPSPTAFTRLHGRHLAGSQEPLMS